MEHAERFEAIYGPSSPIYDINGVQYSGILDASITKMDLKGPTAAHTSRIQPERVELSMKSLI